MEIDLLQCHRSFSKDRSFHLHFRLEGVPFIGFYVFVFYGIQGGIYGELNMVTTDFLGNADTW